MPTSVHIPPALLAAADRKARVLRISRNRLIIQALEHELAPSPGWSAGFFEALATVDRDTSEAVDELRATVTRARRSKAPVRL